MHSQLRARCITIREAVSQSSSAGRGVLEGPLVLCIVASVPRPQAICMKKRAPHWVIPLISASGNDAGAGDERGGEVPPRGQLQNVLALALGSGKGHQRSEATPFLSFRK